MNIEIYRRYLQEYVEEAIDHSDGSNSGISSYLWDKQLGRLSFSNRTEKKRALADARRAFDDHHHWPQEIVLSHMGLDPRELER